MFQTHYARKPHRTARPTNTVESLVYFVTAPDKLVALGDLVSLAQAEARKQGEPIPTPKAVATAAESLAANGLFSEVRPSVIERALV